MPTDDHDRKTTHTPGCAGPNSDADRATVTHQPDPSHLTVAYAAASDNPTADYGSGSTSSCRTADATGTLPDIAEYTVENEIARGGMGVVYRARHLRLNRPAAIKMILGGKYHDPMVRVRFLVEAEAVAALDHPHIVRVFEFGTHDSLPYFVMEFVGGGTLAQRLDRDGTPTPGGSSTGTSSRRTSC